MKNRQARNISTLIMLMFMHTMLGSLTENNDTIQAVKHCIPEQEQDQTLNTSKKRKRSITEVLPVLQPHSNNTIQNLIDMAQIHLAARNGYEEAVEALLKANVDKNAQDGEGFTPLHVAAERGHRKVTKILLAYSADTNALDVAGYTPLHLAAQHGDKVIVKSLLKSHANHTIKTRIIGWSPLHFAAEHGHGTVVKLLLDAGIPKDITNKDGVTSLHLAAQAGREEVVEILLLAGVTLDSRDRWNKTPLYNSLTQYSGKPTPTITQMLLLVGDAPLDGTDQFSVHVCHRLKTWGFNPDAFNSEKRNELFKEYYDAFVKLLENFMPKVVAQLAREYHDCVETRLLVFKQTLNKSNRPRINSLCAFLHDKTITSRS
jgi:hypothetical protein